MVVLYIPRLITYFIGEGISNIYLLYYLIMASVRLSRNDTDRLRLKEIQILRGELFKSYKIPEPLTNRQIDIIRRLKENDGPSQETLVRESSSGSRVTILKAIRFLAQCNIINIVKDESNSQLHHLYLNYNNILLKFSEESECINQMFFELLNSVSAKYGKISDANLVRFKHGHKYAGREYELLAVLITIYRHLVGIYFTFALRCSLSYFGNDVLLYGIYALMFTRIIEMQWGLVNLLHQNTNSSKDRTVLHPQFVHNFELGPEKLELLYSILVEDGFKKDTVQLLDKVWKFGLPFFHAAYSSNWHKSSAKSKLENLPNVISFVSKQWKSGKRYNISL